MVNFGQSGCILSKVVVFGLCGCILAKWLCSGKVVVFGQDASIGQNGCIRTKVVVFRKMVVFGQKL